ncbi:hypothetical protein [Motiliproteus sp. MSK22-1]|uniref:hypothetical protein n=1 Tax=Motiliproteus sp. MSK22-1 TaxID=1897630 RepID=UPI0009784EBC|nr:hypothetical protein [Motiliproteus sp. MSK22-1]OMH39280.1 hypothetical protein BGP75_04095 [Motiliproteus sp. MSK22-1]
MMIADLVDQDDFRERLISIGVPLCADLSPGESVRAALAWRERQDESVRQQLDQLFQTLLENADLLLPEVKSAILSPSLP